MGAQTAMLTMTEAFMPRSMRKKNQFAAKSSVMVEKVRQPSQASATR